jgi:ribose transport system ATP-binding protein
MTYLLETKQICKSFPGLKALDNVDLQVKQAEVLAIVGENGAGKSTLMKILGGVIQRDSGDILIDGQSVAIDSIPIAQKLGISLIHQDLNLAENLDVAANIFLGQEPRRGGILRLLDQNVYQLANDIMQELGLNCSANTLVSELSVAQKQLVEIARALSNQFRILIMDEPTASLSLEESQRLFAIIEKLKNKGVSILYISHRLKEIELIADRVIILRDGKNSGELQKSEISHEAMVRLMVGRELKQFFQHTHTVKADGAAILSITGLTYLEEQKPITFEIRPGEILGMSGLAGSGRTELAETIAGIRQMLTGEIYLAGEKLSIRSTGDAIKAGIFLVPEDRRVHGLVPSASVKENILMGSLDILNKFGILILDKCNQLVKDMCDKLAIKTPSIDQQVVFLSGGNQQKVVLAKWLCRKPRVLIFDEPTQGIDVGAKAEIYSLMDDLAKQGAGILMISSDLEEILHVSDRVLVMHHGSLVGELTGKNITEEAIMNLATGSLIAA